MATAIRMKRGGRTHAPYYRIVVMDSRLRSRGAEIEVLGTYHPCSKPKPSTKIDAHKALDWLRKGAVLSDTARCVFRKAGIMKHFHEGTTPEEAISLHEGAHVIDRGYTAPGTKPKVKSDEAAA